MDVQAEGVVAPDDVTEQLIVRAVVRRVDDPLLLPGTPGMGADRGERDPEAARELVELCAPLADLRGRLGEAVAAARANFDLGGNQLADEVLFEGRSLGGRLQLLEAVRE